MIKADTVKQQDLITKPFINIWYDRHWTSYKTPHIQQSFTFKQLGYHSESCSGIYLTYARTIKSTVIISTHTKLKSTCLNKSMKIIGANKTTFTTFKRSLQLLFSYCIFHEWLTNYNEVDNCKTLYTINQS